MTAKEWKIVVCTIKYVYIVSQYTTMTVERNIEATTESGVSGVMVGGCPPEVTNNITPGMRQLFITAVISYIIVPEYDRIYNMTCAPSNVSDQPA